MRPILCAVTVLLLLAPACTRSEPEAAAPTTPPATEAPSPTEPPPPPIAALTGVELAEPVDRPVLALKIDNASAALPPEGLEDADIVFEEEVEGGITRFLALFHSTDPGTAGPVRSGREVDADLLPVYDPVLGFSGAANPVKSLLRDAGIEFYEEGEVGDAFYRDSSRVAPHNLFAKARPLWRAGRDRTPPEEPIYAFSEDTPSDGRPTGSARVVFSNYANAQWSWSDKSDRWERFQNGTPHATAEGDALAADNVVFLRIETAAGNRRDSAGNPTIELKVIDKGPAFVLRDGERFRARWSKKAADSPIELTTRDGEELPLRPGTTWFELVDRNESLSFSKDTVDSAG